MGNGMRTAQSIEQKKNTETNSVVTGKSKRGAHANSRKNLAAPWKPGESGNPSGRPKDAAGEISRAAFENNRDAIYKAVAQKLMAGDSYAFSVHSDRGYGKLKQGIIHNGNDEGGPIEASIKVEFVNGSK